MEWLDALILGIVQGLTEYLPVSSSGHLEIFKEILGVNLPSDDNLQFDVIVHAATVCSTLVVLWPMFSRLCKSFFTFRRDENFYYVCKLLVSCIPVGVVGVLFKKQVEQIFGSGLTIVGICLCVTAFLLAFAYLSDLRCNRNANAAAGCDVPVAASKGRKISWLDAIIIGCAQAVAVLPGLSRSGSTIATGILLGDRRDEVASFSFLMVIIPILGECLLDVKDMVSAPAAPIGEIGAIALIIGFVSAFIVGCAACKWMIELVKRGKLIWFAVYCVVMGIVCLLW
ncbi:MAG: undecaprenyl-diphosphate phosphatase [Candidatus Amulumruptor caecigallinarius]|nr:undecaprenyl-diphosphate phosphatase [Candidatus Amulumruptor caecigallinarius]